MRVAKRQNKAASRPQAGPQSSPLAPTSSGLSPQIATRRRASFQLPTHQIDSPAGRDSPISEATEEADVEIETPTRPPSRKVRPASAGQRGAGSRLSLQQSTSSNIDASSLEEEEGDVLPPLLRTSHTSPETQDDAVRRRQRPGLTERPASDPIGKPKMTGSEIDRNIANLILNGPKNLKKGDAEGNIYIFVTVPKGDGDVRLMKVGITGGEAGRRGSAIKGKCRHTEMREHPRAAARVIPCYAVAEKLIHAELENFRHHWLCKCNVRHREYFNVSDEVVLEVYSRWRDFCARKPWDKDGNLLPEWKERLRGRLVFDDAREDYNHRKLAKQWRTFTTPLAPERMIYEVFQVVKRAWPRRWIIATGCEFLFMFLTCPACWWIKAFASAIFIMGLLEFRESNLFSDQLIKSVCNGGFQSIICRLDFSEAGGQDKRLVHTTTPREPTPREAASFGSHPQQSGDDFQPRITGFFPSEDSSTDSEIEHKSNDFGGYEDSEMQEIPDSDEDADCYGDDDDGYRRSPSLPRTSRSWLNGSGRDIPALTSDGLQSDRSLPEVIDLRGLTDSDSDDGVE
ncbi:hypothetical protein CPLU01_10044 [Colletotrichum plurivorum]|uniref:Bacteriophage T5 Orf172 DNA-binding domain-containing protein n=1 Tax=Colletotrichum plurivorum TaxID=2175906 RepID=A0A8H6K6T5_9PEZI|nr:hypothetical protein CPLU01_10044 [Colletotrichum plurivorum]